MKKILLVGKPSVIVQSVNENLNKDFDMHTCSFHLNHLDGIARVLKPDMLIVCTIGVGELDLNVFEYINNNCKDNPVVFISSKEDEVAIKEICCGSRFTYMQLPIRDDILNICKKLLEDTPASMSRQATASVNGDYRKILIIDDDAIVLRSVKDVLQSKYAVTLATSGEMGVKKAAGSRPDLILLDYEMPQMNGADTRRQLLANDETKDIPVLFMTSVSDNERVMEILSLKPAGYILKPIDTKLLQEKIESVLK